VPDLSHSRACRRSLILSLLFAACVATVSLVPSRAGAGPTVLDPGGLPVCAATGEQLLPRVVPAADGAAIVVWQDKRRGGSLSDIYALSVAANGTVTPGWPADGAALCASGTAGAPFPVPDGAGGMLVFWHDSRNGGQLFAQRVSAGGVIAVGWAADGKQITTVTFPDAQSLALYDAIPDGAGGAYVARKKQVSYQYFQGTVNRITADGTFSSGWSEDGVNFWGGFTDTYGPQTGVLAEDPGSGVFFAMTKVSQSPESNYSATIGRISADGALLWQVNPPWQGGYYFDGISAIDIAGDGAGNCFTTWLARRYTATPDYYFRYGQRYGSAGAPLWPVNTPSPTYQYVERDGAGGTYLIGSGSSGTTLEVHRRDANGNIPAGWTAAGITVSTPTALGGIARIRIDNLLLCWSENRTGASDDVRAIAIDPAGVVTSGWATDGIVVSDATGNQTEPDVVMMSPGQILACWRDTRTGASDIRAARIGYTVTGVPPGGVAATRLELGAAWPNPARDHARFSLALAPNVRAFAEVVDMSGRVIRRIGSLESGTSQDFQVDTRGLTAGVYWLRVAQGTESATRRFAVLR